VAVVVGQRDGIGTRYLLSRHSPTPSTQLVLGGAPCAPCARCSPASGGRRPALSPTSQTPSVRNSALGAPSPRERVRDTSTSLVPSLPLHSRPCTQSARHPGRDEITAVGVLPTLSARNAVLRASPRLCLCVQDTPVLLPGAPLLIPTVLVGVGVSILNAVILTDT
jgi:hypothetical protein